MPVISFKKLSAAEDMNIGVGKIGDNNQDEFTHSMSHFCLSQWPRDSTRVLSSIAWTLGSYVRISRGTYMNIRFYFVFVLSCVGRGFEMVRSPIQGVLSTVYKIRNSRNYFRIGGGQKA
jgi:hypothetical protein